jgi:hypothetical protein
MYHETTWCFEWSYTNDFHDIALPQLLALAARLDLAPGPGGSRITPIPDTEREAWRVAHSAPPGYASAAFVVLYPSAQLVAHCDPSIAPLKRYHIPLVVNNGCWSFSGDTWQRLEVGKVYAMDPTELHGAVNWGTERRLHLMIDTHA